MSVRTSRLQRRITIALTSIVLGFVIAQGLLAYRALAAQEDELVDEVVQTEARRLVAQLAAGEPVFEDDGGAVDLTTRFRAWLLTDQRPAPLDESRRLPAGLDTLADGLHQRSDGDRERHYSITTTPAGRVVLEYDASQDEAFVVEFGIYLIVLGVVISVLAAVVAVAIARVLAEPMRRVALQMAQWTPGEAPRLVGQTDEETMLLQAFDAAHRRLDESHAREREFVANLRHEVRTPLTALRSDAEMLMLTEPMGEAARGRLRRMQATIDAIAADIESLHDLTQARTRPGETLDLAACVDAVWQGLQHHNGDGRLTLDNRIVPGDTVTADRLALMTILRNLLRNAIDHASPGRCVVERLPDGLRVRDDGPGIASADLPRIFDRHFSQRRRDTQATVRPAAVGLADAPGAPTAGEHGLGLAIARQTALAQDWRLTAASPPAGGASFSLHLTGTPPPAPRTPR